MDAAMSRLLLSSWWAWWCWSKREGRRRARRSIQEGAKALARSSRRNKDVVDTLHNSHSYIYSISHPCRMQSA
jgi:hypothetical protein